MTARPSPATTLNEALRAAPSIPPTLYRTEDIEDLTLDPVERAIADIAAGRPVVVVD
ncbi:bifunctional 3,4-dihydroxy-2-butanone-4-phosphate synthase/GTP cyclohydrolase II, partial [Streptomyces sp. Lzd4kr]|nr:bifunctional 3,4-dihydroxy-2-butanone-4-phosphate synthase/GTP cyclohydrolase II [Streptomyces sp. Lzd4kr]